MSDGKAGSLIEKNNFLGIISALKLWLWVIQTKNDNISGWSPALLPLAFRYVYWM